jgi:hypothetical protein
MRHGIFSVWAFVFISGFNIQAQQSAAIMGSVKDSESGEPLPFANVFIKNSTIGTTTNLNGDFILNQVMEGQHKLIVSFVGYDPSEINIIVKSNTTVKLIVSLTPIKTVLDEIKVTGLKDKKWAKLITEFEKKFLGEGGNAKQTQILNKEIIDLAFDNGILTAEAQEPIVIENRSLGFIVHYYLKTFYFSNEDFQIDGYARFEEMISDNNQQRAEWIINREQTFNGSMQHFLFTLINENSLEEGYHLYFDTTAVELPLPLARHDFFEVYKKSLNSVDTLLHVDLLDSSVYRINIQKRLEIHYTREKSRNRYYKDIDHQVSRLFVKDKMLKCLTNGIALDKNNFALWGDMTYERIADLLPVDYTHHTKRGLQISGYIKDKETRKPIKDAAVFFNQSSIGNYTKTKGEFVLTGVPVGFFSLVVSAPGYRTMISRMRIDSKKNYRLNLELEKSQTPIGKTLSLKNKIRIRAVSELKSILFQGSKDYDSCFLLNPDAIEVVESKGLVTVFSEKPLILENRSSGYRLMFYLQPALLTKISSQTGYYWYDPLPVKNNEARSLHQKRRLDYYNGSSRHLFTCLLAGKSNENGFLFFDNQANKVVPHYLQDRKIDGYYKIDFTKIAKIRHLPIHSVSDLYFPLLINESSPKLQDSSVFATSTGILFNPASVTFSGAMKDKSPLVSIPIDYNPLSLQPSYPSFAKLQEKVIVHTNKAYYYPSEAIFFKAYLKYSDNVYKDSLSSVLYIELIDDKKNIVYESTLPISENTASGAFIIDKDLKPGNFLLRAYTNWMQNWEASSYSQVIPIIPITMNLEMNSRSHSEEIANQNKFKISIQPEKNSYRPRENINIQIKVADSLNHPIAANLSVSVTDANMVINSDESNNHKSSDFDLLKPVIFDTIKYRIERSLIKRGKVLNTQEPITIQFINPENQIFGGTVTDAKGNFELELPGFYDSITFFLKAFRENKEFIPEVRIASRESPYVYDLAVSDNSSLIADKKIRLVNEFNKTENTTILDEVVVKAKRITTGDRRSLWDIAKPDHIIMADRLNGYGNLALALQGRIPGVEINCIGIDCTIRFTRARGGTFMGSSEPLVLIDGNPVGGMGAGAILQTLNPENIEKIGFTVTLNVLYGEAGKNGIISIYTKSGGLNDDIGINSVASNQKIKLFGFDKPLSFKSPQYDNSSSDLNKMDYRSTLYWNPKIKVYKDSDNVTFSFFAADVPTQYRIEVKGLTNEGNPLRCIHYIEVK